MNLASIFQSEYTLAAIFVSFLGLIGLVTYLFGFNSAKPTESQQNESDSKKTKTKAKETKTKKKPEPAQPAPVPELVKQVKKIEEPVKAVKKIEEPVKAVKKIEETKNVKKVEPVKKQAKKEVKKEEKKGEETLVKSVIQPLEETTDASGWTTVIDKRAQKKQKSATPTSSTDSEESVVKINKKTKEVKTEVKAEAKIEVVQKDQLVIGTKQPSELLTESLIQKTETKDKEDDWIPANPKAKKDKKKEKKEVAEVEVKPQVVPVVPEVKSVEKTKPKKNAKKPAQENLVNAIKDAIVDTADSNNNKVNLKQTSLTDSIILIEKESKRTESNQSSNESLQDVDGDDGFITITNKKTKRTVRREH